MPPPNTSNRPPPNHRGNGRTPPTGPDPESYLESIRQYEEAGYTEIYMHQIGPEQEGFFRFFEKEILPELR